MDRESSRRAIAAVRAIRAAAIERRQLQSRVIEIVISKNDEDDDDDDDPFCRYCFEGDAPGNPLIDPCLCIGSQKWIHKQCLDNWRSRWPESDRRSTHCPVCLGAFEPAAPRVLNLGSRNMTASVIYLSLLSAANFNVMVWFIVMSSSLFETWSIPATLCVGVFNGAIASVATAHHREFLDPVELCAGILLIGLNISSFFLITIDYPNALFYTCILSFFISAGMVFRPYRRRVCRSHYVRPR